MRLMLPWTKARMLPVNMVTTASPAITSTHSPLTGRKATAMVRSRKANEAALTAVDMKPVMGAGAPSYTSGVQAWNGAAATLKPKPMISIAMPAMKSGSLAASGLAAKSRRASNWTEPAAP
ncbi:hypothetical protein D3C86_1024300 [compost metagenome]